MAWRRRWRGHARRLTLAEANLRAQCAALEPEHETRAEADAASEVVDVAALERERLFASHPRSEQRPPSTPPRSTTQDSGR